MSFYRVMELKPPPPPQQPQPGIGIRIFVVWEAFMSLAGIGACILLIILGLTDTAGDWAFLWAPVALLSGLLLHLIFMGYRVISYIVALILEVAPAMRNMTDVVKSIFQGRTTG